MTKLKISSELGLPLDVIQSSIALLATNKEWQPRDLSKLRILAIHHTAGPATQTPEQIARYHISKGWSGIGYHFLIYPDGTIYKVRPIGRIPACVLFHNTESICICFVGDFTAVPPTDAALEAGAWLAQQLLAAYDTIGEVKGHREIAGQSTACPGAAFPLESFVASAMEVPA